MGTDIVNYSANEGCRKAIKGLLKRLRNIRDAAEDRLSAPKYKLTKLERELYAEFDAKF